MRRPTWFDLLLKSNIDQNEDRILGPSTVAIAKKLKQIIQKDELMIADLVGAGLEKLKLHYKNDVELEYNVDQLKVVVVSEAQWNSDEYLPRLSLSDIIDMYLLKVQDKMHHLPSEDERDFTNALLLFIRRIVIKNRVEDLYNERLKGRDWNDKDVKRSKKMADKIDQVMKRREQLRRLKDYVGGRPKTINPRVFVRPM
ncbi:hypothetical protein Tco_0385610 [Tanacetum coccineum]